MVFTSISSITIFKMSSICNEFEAICSQALNTCCNSKQCSEPLRPVESLQLCSQTPNTCWTRIAMFRTLEACWISTAMLTNPQYLLDPHSYVQNPWDLLNHYSYAHKPSIPVGPALLCSEPLKIKVCWIIKYMLTNPQYLLDQHSYCMLANLWFLLNPHSTAHTLNVYCAITVMAKNSWHLLDENSYIHVIYIRVDRFSFFYEF